MWLLDTYKKPLLQVFQRRTDDAVDFDRNWTDYLKGFGDVVGSYWLGIYFFLLHVFTFSAFSVFS